MYIVGLFYNQKEKWQKRKMELKNPGGIFYFYKNRNN
jgi:hypothetical protein